MFQHHASIALATDSVALLQTEVTGLNRQERYQLVERIESMIDRVQKQVMGAPYVNSERYQAYVLLDPLRAKRMEVLRSFYPQFNRATQPAAHGL